MQPGSGVRAVPFGGSSGNPQGFSGLRHAQTCKISEFDEAGREIIMLFEKAESFVQCQQVVSRSPDGEFRFVEG
jgi:hypothetical protein